MTQERKPDQQTQPKQNDSQTQQGQQNQQTQPISQQIECIVCGTKVDKGKALTVSYQGRTLNVCSSNCQTQFQADPARYANKGAPVTTGTNH
ncbi:YHS domain-containing protein [Candidatus Acetothermia bacterium]|nr:YHS domain-containing protein [Candidatus Acetothermia bacterium]